MKKVFNLYKKFACLIGWHSPARYWEHIEFDGCSEHCRCPWCGYVGMVDSQGNLF